MAKRNTNSRAKRRLERIPGLIEAVEEEPNDEVRVAIWLTLLLKMTPDEVLGLKWASEDTSTRDILTKSGEPVRIGRLVTQVLVSLPRFRGNPQVCFSLWNERSRYLLADGLRRALSKAGLLNDSFSAVCDSLGRSLRRRDLPELSDYGRRAEADLIDGPRAVFVPVWVDGHHQTGIIVIEIDDDILDELIRYLGFDPEEDDDLEALKERCRNGVGNMLASFKIGPVPPTATSDKRKRITRIRKKAEYLLDAIREADIETLEEVASRGFSDGEQQLVAIESVVTPLNVGEGREALHVLQRMHEENGANWPAQWGPKASPLSDLLDRLVSACHRAEVEMRGSGGRPSEERRDEMIRGLGGWFLDNARPINESTGNPYLADFVEDCLAIVDIDFDRRTLDEILRPLKGRNSS